MSKKTISIEDVAKAAGVSIATVSRVLNRAPSVKEDNRRKVEAAIQKLNFKPNVMAQRLASGSNNTIGLEIPRYEGIFYSFYAMEIFRSVGVMCDHLRVDLLLHLTDHKSIVNPAAVGGVVFADIINNRHHVENFIQMGMPVVVMNCVPQGLDVTTVSVDNTKGAQFAVEHLIGMGHRRIAFLSGDLMTQAALDRLEGYKTALKSAGLPLEEECVFEGDYSRKSARYATEKMLAMEDRPTALFASSDDMAMEAISVLMENGLKVPDDLSIVGFDDDPVCLYGPVALSTVRQPLKEMAQTAVKELFLKMQDSQRQIHHIILPAELVIRDSVKAPRKA